MSATVWDAVLGRIETKVNRHSYYTWFRNTSLASDDGGRLVVRVADPMAIEWLIKHYSSIIDEALVEVGRAGVSLEFRHDMGDPQARGVPATPHDERPEEPVNEEATEAVDQVGLSPRYSFSTFI